MPKDPVKVLVVHSHERNCGSTILAVCRANEAGREIANSFRHTDGADEVSIDEVAITEHVQLSKAGAEALRKIHIGLMFDPGELRVVEGLIERGFVEMKKTAYGITINVSPYGKAALDIYKEP
jgi:hypothetical protein